jgi:hypothetical protein
MGYLKVDIAYAAQFRKKLLSVKEEERLTNEEVAKRFGVGRNSDPNGKRIQTTYSKGIDLLKKLIWKP